MNPVTLEVVRNALYAIAEEMSVVLMRSARSPLLKEAGDLSSALTDAEGRLIAQGRDIPIHMGVMAFTVKEFLRSVPADRLRAGRALLLHQLHALVEQAVLHGVDGLALRLGGVQVLQLVVQLPGEHLLDALRVPPEAMVASAEGEAAEEGDGEDGGTGDGNLLVHGTVSWRSLRAPRVDSPLGRRCSMCRTPVLAACTGREEV